MSTDLVCAIDLDTILPVYLVSALKKIPRVYDAHELFTEMKEVVTRPRVHAFWLKMEAFFVPRFPNGYTVSEPIADYFNKKYEVSYSLVRNLPLKRPKPDMRLRERVILYQGAVNEGRAFEQLIPAMRWVEAPLHIYGDGNFLKKLQQLISENGVKDRVFLMGKKSPEDLYEITCRSAIGLTLFEKEGLSNYFSLANRFFDYIQAATPQICVDFPGYRAINERWEVAVLTADLRPENLATLLNNLLNDSVTYRRLQANCQLAADELNWEKEASVLTSFYQNLPG